MRETIERDPILEHGAYKGSALLREFDSWHEWIDYAASNPLLTGSARDNGHTSDYWDMNAGWDGALRLTREGWPQGSERVERVALRLTDAIASHVGRASVPRWTRSVSGSVPNVARYVQGMPDAMRRRTRVTMPRPIVRIVLNMTVSAGVGAEAMSRKGAAVVALVDLLERYGRRCEVTLIMCDASASRRTDGMYMPSGTHYSETRIVIKRPDAEMLIDQMAFALAHPATFRRLGFADLEMLPDTFKRAINVAPYGTGYGNVTDTLRDRGDVYIGGSHLDQFGNDSDADRWIRDTLTNQGIEVEGDE